MLPKSIQNPPQTLPWRGPGRVYHFGSLFSSFLRPPGLPFGRHFDSKKHAKINHFFHQCFDAFFIDFESQNAHRNPPKNLLKINQLAQQSTLTVVVSRNLNGTRMGTSMEPGWEPEWNQDGNLNGNLSGNLNGTMMGT